MTNEELETKIKKLNLLCMVSFMALIILLFIVSAQLRDIYEEHYDLKKRVKTLEHNG